MYKVKCMLVITVTALIILLGVFLPTVVFTFQDSTFGTPNIKDISTVKLEIGAKNEPVSYAGKLYLLGAGIFIDIDEKDASMREEDAIGLLGQLLEPYFNSNLLPDSLDDYAVDVGARLGYDPEDPEYNIVVWTVGMHNEIRGVYIDLIIDDETGKILHIDVGSNEKPLTDTYNDLVYVFDVFEQIYFGGLGLEPELKNAVSDNVFVIDAEGLGKVEIHLVAYYNGFKSELTAQDAESMQKNAE